MNKVMRKIVSIDESKCDGCGLCIPSCAEGALQIVDGKARLVKDIYCDGLGNCLGECPQGAIEIIEREAEPFNEEAVEEFLKNSTVSGNSIDAGVACAGCAAVGERFIKPEERQSTQKVDSDHCCNCSEAELSHWPVQLHLVSPEARFLQGQDLLIAADCVPFAFADFHRQFLAGRSLVIGCPKLDDTDAYHQKLIEMFKRNKLKSITLLHMEVGCCFGLSRLVRSALEKSGVKTPLQEIVIGVDGKIKETA